MIGCDWKVKMTVNPTSVTSSNIHTIGYDA